MLDSDFQKLSVTGLITLYELDATALGAGIIRWHGHTSYGDWQKIYAWAGKETEFVGNTSELVGKEYDIQMGGNKNIIWQKEVYTPIPIQTDGLEVRGDGKASTPTLALANSIDGAQGAISALCLQFDDFAGAKLTVISTLAKYLDPENFESGNAQAANEYKKQIWYIEQKTSENKSVVSFELSNPVDFADARIPSREITNYCHWAVHGRYRGQECQYMGTARFTSKRQPTTNPAQDKCGGRLADCRLRNNEIRFGGFPSSSLVNR